MEISFKNAQCFLYDQGFVNNLDAQHRELVK